MSEENTLTGAGEESPPHVDGFEIIERLGQGGTSSVWKARQVSLQRFVVIKVLGKHFARDDADIKQFRLEAQIAANLKHPGIVQVYDFGRSRDDHRYYFVMEYVSGYSVGEWMRRKNTLAVNDALVVTHSVAAALRYAWDKSNIVHCDLKPDNIMVDGDGTIKLTDMGLAQVVNTIGHDQSLPDEFVMGTPNYMSPEQVRGDEKLDCRSDIYALGMTLFHMLTGNLPFKAESPSAVVEKQLREPLPDVRQISPDLPAGVAQLVARMTAKNPAQRHQTWNETLDDVTAVEKQPAATIHVGVGDNVAPTPPDLPDCRHCGRPISGAAMFCRHCGKQLQTPPAPIPSPPMPPAVKLRVKPLSELRPAPPMPSRAPTRPAAPARAPARRPKRRFAAFMGNVRMLISIALLGFLGYCGYQKMVNDVDIILPMRMKFQRSFGVTLRRARLRVQELLQRPTPTPPTNDQAADRPADYEAPDESTPEPTGVPPPARALSAPPLPSSRDAQPPAVLKDDTEEYAQLLKLCRNDVPQTGAKVVIDLKHQSEKREGILEKIGADGLTIQIESGILTVPFNVMRSEYRLRYFPEERARLMLQQKNAGQ